MIFWTQKDTCTTFALGRLCRPSIDSSSPHVQTNSPLTTPQALLPMTRGSAHPSLNNATSACLLDSCRPISRMTCTASPKWGPCSGPYHCWRRVLLPLYLFCLGHRTSNTAAFSLTLQPPSRLNVQFTYCRQLGCRTYCKHRRAGLSPARPTPHLSLSLFSPSTHPRA